MRRAAWLAMGLLLLGACSCASAPIHHVPHQTTLLIDPRLLRSLALLEASYDVETAWCLTGVEELHRVSVLGLQAPDVYEQSGTSVKFGGCEGVGIVGWYHNHPPQPWDACAFSDTDEDTFRANNWGLMLASCDGGVFFYQLRGEEGSSRIERAEYAPIPPDPVGSQ